MQVSGDRASDQDSQAVISSRRGRMDYLAGPPKVFVANNEGGLASEEFAVRQSRALSAKKKIAEKNIFECDDVECLAATEEITTIGRAEHRLGD